MSKLHRYKVTNFHSHISMPFFCLLMSFYFFLRWWCNLMKIKFIECKCVFACIIIMVKCFFLSCTNCLYLMKYEIYCYESLSMCVCEKKRLTSYCGSEENIWNFAPQPPSPPPPLHSLKYSCIIIIFLSQSVLRRFVVPNQLVCMQIYIDIWWWSLLTNRL